MTTGPRQAGDGTVAKALTVLDAVAEHGRPVRFSELLEESPYPKATLYRFMQVLTQQGMLSFDPERQTYAPGLRLVRLAHAAWQASSLAPIARPHLDRLSRETGETVHLAQLDGGAGALRGQAQRPANRSPCIPRRARSGPPIGTGVGKAMLAHLPETELAPVLQQQSWHAFTGKTITTSDAMRHELSEIRARGHAFERTKSTKPGIICIAVPILTRSGGFWARCR